MTIELTREEAEILIATLEFTEGVAIILEPAITEALTVLRPWRSKLLETYIQHRMAS